MSITHTPQKWERITTLLNRSCCDFNDDESDDVAHIDFIHLNVKLAFGLIVES